jgi:hypothetical protein
MLSDPEEAWWVVDGALFALKFAPAKDIQQNYKLIEPWTKHSDWWLREAAFMALSGLQKDDALYIKILPTLLKMATSEYHTMPRERMMNQLNSVLQAKKPGSDAGKLIVAGLKTAVTTSEMKSGVRSREGAFNVLESVRICLESSPENAAALAMLLQTRFDGLDTNDMIRLVAAPGAYPSGQPTGFFSIMKKLEPKQQDELKTILYDIYRPELLKRYRVKHSAELLNTLIDLVKLKNPAAGWKSIGKLPPSERVWRFKSFDPIVEKDQLVIHERRRMRDIQLTDDLKDWFKPEYDDSKWNSGRAPVGTALYNGNAPKFANQSDWGKGEFIVMRNSFELDAVDFDFYRLSILTVQGFKFYLNGQSIADYGWWFDGQFYSPWEIDVTRHLKKGTNVLAIYGNAEYDQKTKELFGQMDCFIEGLKISDLE